LGEAWSESGLVFDRGDGAVARPDAVSRALVAMTRSAEVRSIRFHDLRHTLASLMLSAGVNPKVVSERLGHATVGFTLDRYSHLLPGLQEEAAVRTGEVIYGQG
jgi:integrase